MPPAYSPPDDWPSRRNIHSYIHSIFRMFLNPSTNDRPHSSEGRLNDNPSDSHNTNIPETPLQPIPSFANFNQQTKFPVDGAFRRGHILQAFRTHIVPVILLAFPSFYASRAFHLSKMAAIINLRPNTTYNSTIPTSRPSSEHVAGFEKAWVTYLDARVAEWKVVFTLDFVFVGWVRST